MLADARHTEPMPPDVADRLDEVLAGLQESHEDVPFIRPRPSSADVAAAHRRRNVRNWLVAAAAVVVVGVGINQVDWSGMTVSGDGADSSTSDAGVAAEAGGNDVDTPSGADQRYQARRRMARLNLTAENFGSRVAQFRGGGDAGESAAAPEVPADGTYLTSSGALQDYSPICDVGDLGRGYVVPVKYDDERAWLVFRTPEGESQVVDLYLCGQDEPTRSITLPAP
jgi:hypothetical protein